MPQSDASSADDHDEVPDLELEDLLAPLGDLEPPKETDSGPMQASGPS